MGDGSASAASPDIVVDSADYSDALIQISQLVAYTDILLFVLVVLILFGIGLFFGYLVTRWFRGH